MTSAPPRPPVAPPKWQGGDGGAPSFTRGSNNRRPRRWRRPPPAFVDDISRHIRVVRGPRHAARERDDGGQRQQGGGTNRDVGIVADPALPSRLATKSTRLAPNGGRVTTNRVTLQKVGMFGNAIESEVVFQHLPLKLQEKISEDVANLFAASPGADAEQMRWTRAAAGGGRNDGCRVNGLQQTAARREGHSNAAPTSFAHVDDGEHRQGFANAGQSQQRREENSWNNGEPSISRTLAMSVASGSRENEGEHRVGKKNNAKKRKNGSDSSFPADPPIFEIASRLLAFMPELYLRDGHVDTYGMAACALMSRALRETRRANDRGGDEHADGQEQDAQMEKSSSRRMNVGGIYDQTTPFSPVPVDDEKDESVNRICSERVFASPYRPIFRGAMQQHLSDSEDDDEAGRSDEGEEGGFDFDVMKIPPPISPTIGRPPTSLPIPRGWATSSYDDNAKIYDAIAAATWKNFLNEGDGYGNDVLNADFGRFLDG